MATILIMRLHSQLQSNPIFHLNEIRTLARLLSMTLPVVELERLVTQVCHRAEPKDRSCSPKSIVVLNAGFGSPSNITYEQFWSRVVINLSLLLQGSWFAFKTLFRDNLLTTYYTVQDIVVVNKRFCETTLSKNAKELRGLM